MSTLHKVFLDVINGALRTELDVDACEEHEHFCVLVFRNGEKYLLTCPSLDDEK